MLRSAALAVSVVMASASAQATLIEVRFTGTVSRGTDYNANTFAAQTNLAGLPVQLSFFYDSAAIPADSNATLQVDIANTGSAAFLGAQATIGGISVAVDTRAYNEIVARDFQGGFADRLRIASEFDRGSILLNNDENVSASVAHQQLFPSGLPYDPAREMDVTLDGLTGTGTGYLQLWDSPLCGSYCPPGRFADGETHVVDATFVFTRFQVLHVPEPALPALLGMMLAALSARALPRVRARGARSRPSRGTRP